MKLTKYGHACIVLEEQGQRLVIDPGAFTPEFGRLNRVAAVIVTHVHPDHFDSKNLAAIFKQNPQARLFTTAEVAEQFKKPQTSIVAAGQTEEIGPFSLQFYGEQHAQIHSLKPVAQNIGVMVNDSLYYPGDALTLPKRPVKVLALPANAPWLKVSESIDYLKSVKPSAFFFRTHDDLLSANGKMVYDLWFNIAAEAFKQTYKPLEPGESAEI